MNELQKDAEQKRKMAVLLSIADVYTRQAPFTEKALVWMLAALAPFRAAYVERALPLAIRENSFPPGVAELVAIIEREAWEQIDENNFRSDHDEYMHNPIPADEYETWLNLQPGFRGTD